VHLLGTRRVGVSKTKPIMKELETYFLGLTDKNRDELPLEKIFNVDLHCLSKFIAHFLEVSQIERMHQTHNRLFYTIHTWLERHKLIDWINLMQEDLRKALRTSKPHIDYGPQLTKILGWGFANLEFHLRMGDCTEQMPRPRVHIRNPRNPRMRRPRKPRGEPNPNPKPHLDFDQEPSPSPDLFPKLMDEDNDLHFLEILRAIPNIVFEGSHHVGGDEKNNTSNLR